MSDIEEVSSGVPNLNPTGMGGGIPIYGTKLKLPAGKEVAWQDFPQKTRTTIEWETDIEIGCGGN
ncbi:MAG: hypothetical protein LBM59_00105 [Ruminococcus sp.]|jgi:hypothetical protein|nr:hypothetical protein [Ruminococcus sp.]